MKKILYAPNVWTGGGLVLLKGIMESGVSFDELILDRRAKDYFSKTTGSSECFYVSRTLLSRLHAEFHLKKISSEGALILCFHGLPPIFDVKGRVAVFVQNRNLLGQDSLSVWPWKIALRIFIERFWGKFFKFHVSHYIVQTESMARNLCDYYGASLVPHIMPFGDMSYFAVDKEVKNKEKAYDFVYIASEDAHKNHVKLIQAWIVLADGGNFPSLAITIDQPSETLSELIDLAVDKGAKITNVGLCSRQAVQSLYRLSRALIYPSFSESFGLPLLEANESGLPIIASEMDYVRDVIAPVETFDPHSEVSIARAVRRFAGAEGLEFNLLSAADFLDQLITLD